jgi:hypothetical protein
MPWGELDPLDESAYVHTICKSTVRSCVSQDPSRRLVVPWAVRLRETYRVPSCLLGSIGCMLAVRVNHVGYAPIGCCYPDGHDASH